MDSSSLSGKRVLTSRCLAMDYSVTVCLDVLLITTSTSGTALTDEQITAMECLMKEAREDDFMRLNSVISVYFTYQVAIIVQDPAVRA
jgi:hypothetical protein